MISYHLLSDVMSMLLIRYSKFQSVASITLHFPESFGGDITQIHYIGLKGEATQVMSLPYYWFDGCCWSWLLKKRRLLVLWFILLPVITVKEGCRCNNCLWTYAKSFRPQVIMSLSLSLFDWLVTLICFCGMVFNHWVSFWRTFLYVIYA